MENASFAITKEKAHFYLLSFSVRYCFCRCFATQAFAATAYSNTIVGYFSTTIRNRIKLLVSYT